MKNDRMRHAWKKRSSIHLEDKVGILHAQSKFSSTGVPRLGIPELWTTNGPHGIRPEVKWDEWDQAGWLFHISRGGCSKTVWLCA